MVCLLTFVGLDILSALGGKAALTAKLELPDIPVIFCMVLGPA